MDRFIQRAFIAAFVFYAAVCFVLAGLLLVMAVVTDPQQGCYRDVPPSTAGCMSDYECEGDIQ